MGPVVLVADAVLQEEPISPEDRQRLRVPKLSATAPPAGEPAAVADLAKMLVAAENPRINAGRLARTPNGITLLVELAELLQAAVNGGGDRVNFPSRHRLAGNGSGQADLILNLEVSGAGGPGAAVAARAPNAKTISISALDLYIKSNLQDFQHMADVDLAIAADAEASLPSLIEEVKRQLTADRRRALQERGAKLAEVHQQARAVAKEGAAYGWDANPISLARLTAELWAQIKNEDWSLVSNERHASFWPTRLWTLTSTTNSSARRVARALATTLLHRSGPRLPTGNTGG
jgi:thiamine pyrophosphate-dependent acetolactate synthase large subunit-like protein